MAEVPKQKVSNCPKKTNVVMARVDPTFWDQKGQQVAADMDFVTRDDRDGFNLARVSNKAYLCRTLGRDLQKDKEYESADRYFDPDKIAKYGYDPEAEQKNASLCDETVPCQVVRGFEPASAGNRGPVVRFLVQHTLLTGFRRGEKKIRYSVFCYDVKKLFEHWETLADKQALLFLPGITQGNSPANDPERAVLITDQMWERLQRLYNDFVLQKPNMWWARWSTTSRTTPGQNEIRKFALIHNVSLDLMFLAADRNYSGRTDWLFWAAVILMYGGSGPWDADDDDGAGLNRYQEQAEKFITALRPYQLKLHRLLILRPLVDETESPPQIMSDSQVILLALQYFLRRKASAEGVSSSALTAALESTRERALILSPQEQAFDQELRRQQGRSGRQESMYGEDDGVMLGLAGAQVLNGAF